jgi:hypothetical protein
MASTGLIRAAMLAGYKEERIEELNQINSRLLQEKL